MRIYINSHPPPAPQFLDHSNPQIELMTLDNTVDSFQITTIIFFLWNLPQGIMCVVFLLKFHEDVCQHLKYDICFYDETHQVMLVRSTFTRNYVKMFIYIIVLNERLAFFMFSVWYFFLIVYYIRYRGVDGLECGKENYICL